MRTIQPRSYIVYGSFPVGTFDNPIQENEEQQDQDNWHQAANQAQQARYSGSRTIDQVNEPISDDEQNQQRSNDEAGVGLAGIFAQIANAHGCIFPSTG